jgi:ribosome biogenesis GTPase
MSSTDDGRVPGDVRPDSTATEESAASLRALGADAPLLSQFEVELRAAPKGAFPGRVSRVDRGRFQIMSEAAAVSVSTSGVSPVCVGDWCILIGEATANDGTTTYGLFEVLPRRSSLVRQSSGSRTEVQALAANIDAVMVVIPLDRPISVRQIERFLVLAWDSGAEPVLILTKTDLVSEQELRLVQAEVGSVSGEIDLLPVSVVTGDGMDKLHTLVRAERTVALLGTSGSGKSSLVNALTGSDVVQVGAVRQSDAKGRHTTTWRELVVVPSGGVLIDTPGLRELGMWIDEEGIDATFTDVTDLAEQCRFSDCAHASEPGCAVIAAIAAGDLDPERLASYRKLLDEAAYAAGKNDHRLAREDQKKGKQRTGEGRSRARP